MLHNNRDLNVQTDYCNRFIVTSVNIISHFNISRIKPQAKFFEPFIAINPQKNELVRLYTLHNISVFSLLIIIVFFDLKCFLGFFSIYVST